MAEELARPQWVIGRPLKFNDLVDGIAVDVSDLSLAKIILLFANFPAVVEESCLSEDLPGIIRVEDDFLGSSVGAIVEVIGHHIACGLVKHFDQAILEIVDEQIRAVINEVSVVVVVSVNPADSLIFVHVVDGVSLIRGSLACADRQNVSSVTNTV